MLQMLKSLAAAGVLAAALTAPVLAAPPATQAAQEFIADVAEETFAIMRDPALDDAARKTAIRAIMDRDVAVDYIARLALGRHGRARDSLSADERQAFNQQLAEYNALFPDYIFNKLYDLVISKFAAATVQVTGTTAMKATDTVVHTKVNRPAGQPILADWRVRADRKGVLKVIDVKAEGISLLVTQRDDFAAIMGTGGLPKLLEHMRTQAAAVTAATVTSDQAVR